jgi:hypothetical protein
MITQIITPVLLASCSRKTSFNEFYKQIKNSVILQDNRFYVIFTKFCLTTYRPSCSVISILGTFYFTRGEGCVKGWIGNKTCGTRNCNWFITEYMAEIMKINIANWIENHYCGSDSKPHFQPGLIYINPLFTSLSKKWNRENKAKKIARSANLIQSQEQTVAVIFCKNKI